MLHDDAEKMLHYADELLRVAENEMSRSEEDVVTHLICVNSRLSMANFFAGFLDQRDVTIVRPVTLQGLLDQCREVDPRFETIDLTPVQCRCEGEEGAYCLNLDQVDKCLRIAQRARSMVMTQTPGY